jgi:hypothetical protein
MNTITIKKKHLKWAVITIFFMIVGANCYSEYREETGTVSVSLYGSSINLSTSNYGFPASTTFRYIIFGN